MKKKQTGIIWAVALILTGLIILLSSFEVIVISESVFLFAAIAVIGVVFHVACFVGKPRKYNLLVPGGMLIIIAALFIAREYSDNININVIWPIIILSAAFGMLEQKIFSKGAQGSWVSIIVVSIIGFFFLIKYNLGFGKAFGALLIVIGIIIVARITRTLPKPENKKTEEAPKDEFDEI
ncbi:MAG: hypothetical protein JXN65_09470 [Clostridia bacterium]|nr:hypothetical protein [Clostridia bacterium]